VLNEIRARLISAGDRIGGPSRAMDERLGKSVSPSIPFILDFKSRIIVYGFNSAIISGSQRRFLEATESAIELLRKETRQKKDVIALLDQLEEERWIDPSRIDPREISLFNEIVNLLRDDVPDFENYTKIAVLHHHVDPVIPEEVTSFENLINAGRFKYELSEAKFDLVLHGHKHWPDVHFDIPADDLHRKLIISGGTVGGGEGAGKEPGFFSLDFPDDRSSVYLTYIPITIVGNPRAVVQKAYSLARPYPLGGTGIRTDMRRSAQIPLKHIFSRTGESLFRYLRHQPHGDTDQAGWSHVLDENRISVIGTAYGLLIIDLIGAQDVLVQTEIPKVINTLYQLRNSDGGWSSSSQSNVSRPEPTAYVLAALSKWVSSGEISEYTIILENMLGSNDSVLWGSTYSLSLVARTLAEISPKSAILEKCSNILRAGAYPTAQNPVHWGRQLTNIRNDNAASLVHTAHAILALRKMFEVSQGQIGSAPRSFFDATNWLLSREFWPNTTEDIKRQREPNRWDTLVVKHNTAPWTILALLSCEADIQHPAIRSAIRQIVDENEEGLWNWGDIQHPIWATYDSILALKEYCLTYLSV
jgi:hypothetical protein